MDKELENVLSAKEERWSKRLLLSQENKCAVVSISLCVPLKYRTNDSCKETFYGVCKLYEKYSEENGIPLIYKGKIDGADGPTVFYVSKNNALAVKKIAAAFETLRKCFRIMDIDIMDESLKPIGREDINLSPRKCFICDNESAVCVKAKTHSGEELDTAIKSYFDEAEKILK